VTTEALGPGSVLVSKERRESLGEEECLDWASAPKEKALVTAGCPQYQLCHSTTKA